MRKPLEIPSLTAEEVEALEKLYRTTKDVRLRTRAQIVLLAGEQWMTAPAIAKIVRENDQTIRNWHVSLPGRRPRGTQRSSDAKCSLQDHAGVEEQVCAAARRRPRSLGQPYSLWTLQRLADYMAEQTGIRVSYETIRRVLAEAEIVLSRPQHKISSPDPEYLVKKED